MKRWLFKSEPEAFSIDDLAALPGARDHWDGIRNYQARNFMRDDMQTGDQGFFYHSSCAVPGIAGIVEICREAYPDHTALDPQSDYFDARSTVEAPRWMMVDVRLLRRFERIVTLEELKTESSLEGMALLKRGNRLSVMPVEKSEWDTIVAMADRPDRTARDP